MAKSTHYGQFQQKKRAKQLFPELDRLGSPPANAARGHYKGLKVYAKNSKTKYGRATGSTRDCNLDGCRGTCLEVIWPDGWRTWPCGKGMTGYSDGWRIL